jgi:hypothetical protein
MPRPRPPRLHRQRTRHGKTVWYARVGHGPRIRLRAEFGSPEFEAEYRAAISGQTVERGKKAAAVGSLTWLFDRYRETVAWTALSLATRRQRENIFEGVLKQSGHESAAAIKRAHIVAGRDRRAETPAQSRNFLDAMRGLFRWALDAGHVRADPTAGVKNPARPKGAGFPVWTEDDVAAYERRSAPRNGYGSTCCYSPASAAAMPSSSGASMCATAWRRSGRRRAKVKSR